MRKGFRPESRETRSKRAEYKKTRQKASQIANAASENNCEIIRISKGKTSIVAHKIEGNQMEVVVPEQVPIDRLAFHINKLLRDHKQVKIEIVGLESLTKRHTRYGLALRKRSCAKCVLKKGDEDDGSGTGSRNGKVKK